MLKARYRSHAHSVRRCSLPLASSSAELHGLVNGFVRERRLVNALTFISNDADFTFEMVFAPGRADSD
jgi:hypothetical protein